MSGVRLRGHATRACCVAASRTAPAAHRQAAAGHASASPRREAACPAAHVSALRHTDTQYSVARASTAAPTPFCVVGAPALWPQTCRRFGRAPGRPAARRGLRIEMRMETALLHAHFDFFVCRPRYYPQTTLTLQFLFPIDLEASVMCLHSNLPL